MACEQPLMDQEFVFLQILGAVSRFEFDTEGKLVLHSDDGTLVASRK
jgi:heat shock protein HslJ